MTKEAIKLEQVLALLPKKVSLYYVDYRDDLSESLDKVQAAIHGDTEELDEIFMDWDTWESVKYVLNELKDDLQSTFDIEEDEAQDLLDEYEDELRDAIYNRDDSTPLKDLLRNTGSQVFFYDTGMEIGGYTDDLKERLRDCKKALKILLKNKEHDKHLEDMCCNASYGGRLVVYFNDDLDDWINLDEKLNTIHFSGNVTIAIINNGNGSGGDTAIRHSFSLPFDAENLFLDKTVSYSYTYEVCGMSRDWCDGTEVTLLTKKSKKKAEKSSINDHIEKEKRLDKVYKDGGCTFLDMKYTRHRNTTYINNFPCGNKCLDCGTFWID
jgi:hypothetical protein